MIDSSAEEKGIRVERAASGAGIVRSPAVVIDVVELARSAEFWGNLLGVEPGPVRSGGSYLTVGAFDGGPLLVLQRVSERKTGKNRVHLDFTVDDVATAIAIIERLGGRAVSDPLDGGGVTMADVEGNEFCIGAFTRDAAGARVPV
jgi:predicted enzyme related to lactoylglutathione lyase